MMINQALFRDERLAKRIIKKVNALSAILATKWGRPVQIMEICGGHTHAIFHAGLDQLLTNDLEFIHGPGCPVCVLPKSAIDRAIYLAQQPDVILATFGDVIRVPGQEMSLQEARAHGADVRILYSPYDAIALAQSNPDNRVVFFAVGFDTTMPSIALTIQAAHKQGVTNLSFLCYHIRLMPTLTALLDQEKVQLDGFIGPGHVSVVIGRRAFIPIAERFAKPLVIAGFEPVDILTALQMTLQQLVDGRCQIENAYARVVSENGNVSAQQAMTEVFEDSCVDWRGVGEIEQSVSSLKPAYEQYDASVGVKTIKPLHTNEEAVQSGLCQDVLVGNKKPDECPYFRQQCNPENPIGPLMVSSEGACAAYFKYKKHNRHTLKGPQHG